MKRTSANNVNKLTNYFSKILKKETSDSSNEQDINISTTNTLCDCYSVVFSAFPTSTSDSEKQEHATDGENTSSTNVKYRAARSDQQWLQRKEKHKCNFILSPSLQTSTIHYCYSLQ
jgi:hypothetical protein